MEIEQQILQQLKEINIKLDTMGYDVALLKSFFITPVPKTEKRDSLSREAKKAKFKANCLRPKKRKI